jgi:hypothetical protein
MRKQIGMDFDLEKTIDRIQGKEAPVSYKSFLRWKILIKFQKVVEKIPLKA